MNKRNTGAESRTWTPSEIVVALIALACALLLYGAVPFLMLPTLGQAVWTMGFAESFANGHLLDFYAHDFGIPKPAAMAFGLAGAWPASLLVRIDRKRVVKGKSVSVRVDLGVRRIVKK